MARIASGSRRKSSRWSMTWKRRAPAMPPRTAQPASAGITSGASLLGARLAGGDGDGDPDGEQDRQTIPADGHRAEVEQHRVGRDGEVPHVLGVLRRGGGRRSCRLPRHQPFDDAQPRASQVFDHEPRGRPPQRFPQEVIRLPADEERAPTRAGRRAPGGAGCAHARGPRAVRRGAAPARPPPPPGARRGWCRARGRRPPYRTGDRGRGGAWASPTHRTASWPSDRARRRAIASIAGLSSMPVIRAVAG